MSREVARLTPDERLAHALSDYARAKTGRADAVVSDYAAVLYVEELDPETGSSTPLYVYAVPRAASWHALRGLAATLVDYVLRLRPSRN